MINFNGRNRFPKCMDKIATSGHWLMYVDDVIYCSSEQEVQGIIDSYTLEMAKTDISENIAKHAKELRDKVVSNISAAEMASWPLKVQEAETFVKTNDPNNCPLLFMEASVRGITLAALVAKVQENSSRLSSLEAFISGVDGRHRDTVSALQTFEEIADYDYTVGWPGV